MTKALWKPRASEKGFTYARFPYHGGEVTMLQGVGAAWGEKNKPSLFIKRLCLQRHVPLYQGDLWGGSVYKDACVGEK